MTSKQQAIKAANGRPMFICLYQIGNSIVPGWGLFSDAQTAETTMRNHIEHMHQTHGVSCLGGVVKVLLEADDHSNGSEEPWMSVCDDDRGVRRYVPAKDHPHIEEAVVEGDTTGEVTSSPIPSNNEPW